MNFRLMYLIANSRSTRHGKLNLLKTQHLLFLPKLLLPHSSLSSLIPVSPVSTVTTQVQVPSICGCIIATLSTRCSASALPTFSLFSTQQPEGSYLTWKASHGIILFRALQQLSISLLTETKLSFQQRLYILFNLLTVSNNYRQPHLP